MYLLHEIVFSKKKFVFLLLICLVFFCCGYWFCFLNPRVSFHGFESNAFRNFIGWVCLISSICGAYLFLKRLFTKDKIAITITKDRIIDNTNLIKGKREFYFSDIEKIDEFTVNAGHSTQRFIGFFMKNNEQYILSNPPSFISKWMSKFNSKMYGTSFFLNATALKMKHSDLLLLLQSELRAYYKNK